MTVRPTTAAGRVSGIVRSWYCPSGARVTPTWASSTCTHRHTYRLKNFAQDGKTVLVGRISSTERSAFQQGAVVLDSATTSRSHVVFADLRMARYSGTIRATDALAGAGVLRTAPQYAMFEKVG